jgi:hypothetical protein
MDTVLAARAMTAVGAAGHHERIVPSELRAGALERRLEMPMQILGRIEHRRISQAKRRVGRSSGSHAPEFSVGRLSGSGSGWD